MRMRNPPHPGAVIRALCLAPLRFPNCSTAAPAYRRRCAQAFDTTPESWLGMQMEYDLWQTEKRAKRLKVKRLVA